MIYSLFKNFIFYDITKPAAVVSNLSMSRFSISDFKLAKSTVSANFNVSTSAAFFKSAFVTH